MKNFLNFFVFGVRMWRTLSERIIYLGSRFFVGGWRGFFFRSPRGGSSSAAVFLEVPYGFDW